MFLVVANKDASDMLVEVSEDGNLIIEGRIPRELWNDEVGDNADAAVRLKWATDHSDQITRALVAKHRGYGVVREPFTRVVATGARDAN